MAKLSTWTDGFPAGEDLAKAAYTLSSSAGGSDPVVAGSGGCVLDGGAGGASALTFPSGSHRLDFVDSCVAIRIDALPSPGTGATFRADVTHTGLPAFSLLFEWESDQPSAGTDTLTLFGLSTNASVVWPYTQTGWWGAVSVGGNLYLCTSLDGVTWTVHVTEPLPSNSSPSTVQVTLTAHSGSATVGAIGLHHGGYPHFRPLDSLVDSFDSTAIDCCWSAATTAGAQILSNQPGAGFLYVSGVPSGQIAILSTLDDYDAANTTVTFHIEGPSDMSNKFPFDVSVAAAQLWTPTGNATEVAFRRTGVAGTINAYDNRDSPFNHSVTWSGETYLRFVLTTDGSGTLSCSWELSSDGSSWTSVRTKTDLATARFDEGAVVMLSRQFADSTADWFLRAFNGGGDPLCASCPLCWAIARLGQSWARWL